MLRKYFWYKDFIDNVFFILGVIFFFYIVVKLFYLGGLSCLDRRGVVFN